MISYKTTWIVALNLETKEEVARHFVKNHCLFTVAQRDCGAETCGTSEASETPVSSSISEGGASGAARLSLALSISSL